MFLEFYVKKLNKEEFKTYDNKMFEKYEAVGEVIALIVHLQLHKLWGVS